MHIVNHQCKESFETKLRYFDQVEILLDMLIESGRILSMEDKFTMPHDDVVIILEMIRERLIDIHDC